MGYKEKPLINQLLKRLHTSGDVQRQKASYICKTVFLPQHQNNKSK